MMSVAEYASHRGVSRQAVDKAIRAGRIPAERRGKRYVIDPAAADAAWETHTDAFRGGVPWMHRAPVPEAPAAGAVQKPEARPPAPPLEPAIERALREVVEQLIETQIETEEGGKSFLPAALALPLAVIAAANDGDADPIRRRLREIISATAKAAIDFEAIRAEDDGRG